MVSIAGPERREFPPATGGMAPLQPLNWLGSGSFGLGPGPRHFTVTVTMKSTFGCFMDTDSLGQALVSPHRTFVRKIPGISDRKFRMLPSLTFAVFRYR